jgi:hypothetical protein
LNGFRDEKIKRERRGKPPTPPLPLALGCMDRIKTSKKILI